MAMHIQQNGHEQKYDYRFTDCNIRKAFTQLIFYNNNISVSTAKNNVTQSSNSNSSFLKTILLCETIIMYNNVTARYKKYGLYFINNKRKITYLI